LNRGGRPAHFHLRAQCAQAFGSGFELVVFGRDDQVEVMFRELFGQFEPDAPGSAGHHR
jgi:hypothetical protein